MFDALDALNFEILVFWCVKCETYLRLGYVRVSSLSVSGNFITHPYNAGSL